MRWWCPATTEVIRRDLSVARERVTPAEAASGAARRVELAFAGAVGYSPVPKREAGLRRKAMLEQIDRGASKPEAVRTALAVNPLATRDAALKAKLAARIREAPQIAP